MFRKIRVALTLLLLAGMGVFLYWNWAVYRNVPKNYEWNEVDSFLKTNGGPDDLLLFEPSWLAGYAQDLGRLRPYSVVKKHEVFQKTYPPSSRLWFLTMFKTSSLDHRLKEAGFAVEESKDISTIHLTRYRIPSRNVLYDFVEKLPSAEIFVDYGDGNIQKSELRNGSWVFSDNPEDWNNVSVGSQSFRGQMRRCIWIHPIEKGVKTIRYSGVPLGKRIELFGGIVDDGLQTPLGAPVYLFVQINGQPLANFEFKDTDTSFGHVVDTASLSGTTGDVTFYVETSNQAARHFCFSAWCVNE